MTSTDLMELERAFWLQGEDFFAKSLAANAVMVFPEPPGVLTDGEIIQSLRGVPRWSAVEIQLLAHRDQGDLRIISYRAEASREGDPPYCALCSSVYAKVGGDWKLCLHQQTPLG
jgi:Domain of unknown function (DUF4440)